MDYYQILGLSKNASADEIKNAYRRLALECHPDRNNGDKQMEDRFKRISSAYLVLTDSNQKFQNDQYPNFRRNDNLINIEEIMRKLREDIKLPLWLKFGINETIIMQAKMVIENRWQECRDLSESNTAKYSITPSNCAFFRLSFKSPSKAIILRATSSKSEYFKIVLFDKNAQVIGICKPTIFATHLDAVHIPWKHVVFSSLNADVLPDKYYIQDSLELQNKMIICVYCEEWIKSVNFKLALKQIETNDLQEIDELLIQKEMDLKELEKITTKKYGQKINNAKINLTLDNEWEKFKNKSFKCITYNGPNLKFEESTEGKLELFCNYEEENRDRGYFSCFFGSSEPKKRKLELQKVNIVDDKINGVSKMVLNPEITLQGNLQFNEAHYFLVNLDETAVRFENKDRQGFKIWVYDSTGDLIYEERARFPKSQDATVVNYPMTICNVSNMNVTICLTNVDYLPLRYTLYTANTDQIIKDSTQYQSSQSTEAQEISKLIKRRIEIYETAVPL